MPAIWRMLGVTAAPESTIMSSGLKAWFRKLASMAPPDLGVGRGPDLDLLLAPLVVVMMPRLNCVSAFWASSSSQSRIATLSGGVYPSSMEMVRPDWAA